MKLLKYIIYPMMVLMNLGCDTQEVKYNKFSVDYSEKIFIPSDIDFIILSPYAKVRGNRDKAYAYISLTELSKNSINFNDFPKDVFMEYNKTWSSFLVDISHSAWQNLIDKEIAWIKKQGFTKVFIDTVDGIETLCRLNNDKCDLYKQQATQILQHIKTELPEGMIINRGFVLYPHIKDIVDGVLIESYFFGKQGNKFVRRNQSDMNWLNAWVQRFKNDNQMILAIDYAENLSPTERKELQKIANQTGILWKLTNESLYW